VDVQIGLVFTDLTRVRRRTTPTWATSRPWKRRGLRLRGRSLQDRRTSCAGRDHELKPLRRHGRQRRPREMSSWAVWAALACTRRLRAAPSGAGQPAVPATTITRRNAKVITTTRGRLGLREVRAEPARHGRGVGPRLGAGSPFVATVARSTTLGTTANTVVGCRGGRRSAFLRCRPTPARTGAVGGLASKCMDADQDLNATAPRSDLGLQLLRRAAMDPGLGRHVAGVGPLPDVSASKRDNATKVQLWTATPRVAQQWVAEGQRTLSTRLRASAWTSRTATPPMNAAADLTTATAPARRSGGA